MSWAIAVAIAVLAHTAQDPLPASPVTAARLFGDRLQIGGQVSVLADALPRLDAVELRPQAAVEAAVRLPGPWRARFEGFAEALVADRGNRVTDAAFRVREAWIEAAGARADVRVGYGRLAWGRLDEIQPSDVINPIDASRFLFDGRSAARLAVAFVRGRVFASEGVTIEGVIAPVFRRGVFDELDEASSPFNLTRDLVLPAETALVTSNVDRRAPKTTLRNVAGGARISATVGRVDLAVGAFRGWDGFGMLSFEPVSFVAPAVVGTLVETFPRFTMVAGDFETVIGDWALRGEAALFTEKTFAGGSVSGFVRGRALDAGVGFDHGSAGLRVFASVLVHRQWSEADASIDRTDVTLVGSVERQFGRERYLARVFGAVTPDDRSGFVRGLVVWKARDDVTVDVSAAAFVGTGEITLGRFHGRDFILTRLRYHW